MHETYLLTLINKKMNKKNANYCIIVQHKSLITYKQDDTTAESIRCRTRLKMLLKAYIKTEQLSVTAE